jgi:hypothetical protein
MPTTTTVHCCCAIASTVLDPHGVLAFTTLHSIVGCCVHACFAVLRPFRSIIRCPLSSSPSIVRASMLSLLDAAQRRGHHQQAMDEIHSFDLGAANPIATIGAEATSIMVCWKRLNYKGKRCFFLLATSILPNHCQSNSPTCHFCCNVV